MDEQRKADLAKRREADLAKQKKDLDKQYKERGIQKLSLSEYEKARKKSDQKKKEFKLPVPVQVVLAVPFLLIFCVGIVFLPYIYYLIITSPSAHSHKSEKEITVSQPVQQPDLRTVSDEQKP